MNRTVVAPLSSAIIALLLAGMVVVGVDQVGETVQPGQARLAVAGAVEVAVDGAGFAPARDDQVLERSDRIRVVDGEAVLELPGGARAELRSGSSVSLASGRDADLVLEAGDLLVESRRGALEVDGGMALMSVTGVAKLRRSVSLVAGVYEGNVVMVKDERQLGIPRYRQAAAAGTGILPSEVDPLRLDADDPWDARIVPDILALDRQLVSLGQDFDAELPESFEATPELFRQVVPALSEAPIRPEVLAGRSAGENLIGLVLVSLEDRGGFDANARNVFAFRSEGASWGLVAFDRDLNPNPVVDDMEFALGALEDSGQRATERPRSTTPTVPVAGDPGSGERGGDVSDPQAPVPGRPVGSSTTRPSGSRSRAHERTSPATGGGKPPADTPSPPTYPNPTPPSTPPPRDKVLDVPPIGVPVLDGVLEPVVDPLEDLLSGVLEGVVGSPSGASSPAPTQPATPASEGSEGSGGLLGGVTGAVGGLLGGS
ncbi:MAG: hypothetical protein ACRDY7_10745 [Acidimicrobiia bacterium]